MRVTRNYMSSLLNGINPANSTSSLWQRALSRSSKSKSTGRSALLTGNKNNGTNPFASTVKSSGNTQKLYYNMKYHASQVSDYAKALTDKEDSSIFARARANGSTSEVIANIKGFVGQYNGMIQNLRDSGSRSYSNYLLQLNSIASVSSQDLASCGVIKKADGTLVVDDKKLAAADLDTLEKVWNGNGFASRTALWSDSIEASAKNSMDTEASNSYNNFFNNYGRNGSYFNFFR